MSRIKEQRFQAAGNESKKKTILIERIKKERRKERREKERKKERKKEKSRQTAG